jgi:hypothetical protein
VPLVRMVVWIGLALLKWGCAAPEIPSDPGPAMQPRASRTIRAGRPSGRGTIVRRSDVRAPCVIRLAATGDEAFASVSVYLYAVGARTTYQTIFFVSFIGDTGTNRTSINLTGRRADLRQRGRHGRRRARAM